MPPNNPLSYENLQALDLSKHRHVSGFLPLTHPDEERLHQESLSSKNVGTTSSTSSIKGFNAMFLDQDNQEESLGLIVEPAVQTIQTVVAGPGLSQGPVPVPNSEQYSEQVQGILAQEKAFLLLSCDCMVQNLVKDSVSRRQALEEEQEEEAAIVESKEECYWDMPSSSSSSCITTDITTDVTTVTDACQECPVQAALESVVTSSSTTTCFNDQVMTAAHVDDATHPNHAYWDHPSDSHMTPKDHQAQLLQSIMESEAIRNLLSAEHISQVEQLNSTARVVHSSVVGTSSSKQVQHEFYSNQVSDAYWNTSPTQVVEACHVQDGTHPHHSYWDEPTTCTTIATLDGTCTRTTDKKQALIDMIMEQERLRNLVSTDFIVQTELESSTSTRTTSSSSSPISSSTSSSTESNDYWTHPNQISSETMAELSRQDLIQQIVQEEKERQLVSTHAIVQQLIQDSQQQQQKQQCTTSSAIVSSPCVVNTVSTSYWDW